MDDKKKNSTSRPHTLRFLPDENLFAHGKWRYERALISPPKVTVPKGMVRPKRTTFLLGWDGGGRIIFLPSTPPNRDDEMLVLLEEILAELNDSFLSAPSVIDNFEQVFPPKWSYKTWYRVKGSSEKAGAQAMISGVRVSLPVAAQNEATRRYLYPHLTDYGGDEMARQSHVTAFNTDMAYKMFVGGDALEFWRHLGNSMDAPGVDLGEIDPSLWLLANVLFGWYSMHQFLQYDMGMGGWIMLERLIIVLHKNKEEVDKMLRDAAEGDGSVSIETWGAWLEEKLG